jgi:hypothetical protein
MSVYVGIDVHRKRSQVAVVSGDGQVQLNRNVVNGSEPMLRLIGGLPGGTPVAFEAAYGWGWLIELLEDYGSQARRAGGRCRVAGLCPRHRRAARSDDHPGGQRPGRAPDGTLRRRPAPRAAWPAPTARTNGAASAIWPGCANGSKRSSTPSRTSSAWNDTAAEPPPGYSPASPSGCSPLPPPSGTTGRPAPTTSDP